MTKQLVPSILLAIVGLLLCLMGIAMRLNLSPLSVEILGLMAIWIAPIPAIGIATVIFAAHQTIKDQSLRLLVTFGLLATEFLLGAMAAAVTDF